MVVLDIINAQMSRHGMTKMSAVVLVSWGGWRGVEFQLLQMTVLGCQGFS